jgi:hypothetical protein
MKKCLFLLVGLIPLTACNNEEFRIEIKDVYVQPTNSTSATGYIILDKYGAKRISQAGAVHIDATACFDIHCEQIRFGFDNHNEPVILPQGAKLSFTIDDIKEHFDSFDVTDETLPLKTSDLRCFRIFTSRYMLSQAVSSDWFCSVHVDKSVINAAPQRGLSATSQE